MTDLSENNEKFKSSLIFNLSIVATKYPNVTIFWAKSLE
jgi:hypothetical protein